MFEDSSRIYGVKEFSSEAVMTITYTRCDLRSTSSTLKKGVQVNYSPSLSRDRSSTVPPTSESCYHWNSQSGSERLYKDRLGEFLVRAPVA